MTSVTKSELYVNKLVVDNLNTLNNTNTKLLFVDGVEVKNVESKLQSNAFASNVYEINNYSDYSTFQDNSALPKEVINLRINDTVTPVITSVTQNKTHHDTQYQTEVTRATSAEKALKTVNTANTTKHNTLQTNFDTHVTSTSAAHTAMNDRCTQMENETTTYRAGATLSFQQMADASSARVIAVDAKFVSEKQDMNNLLNTHTTNNNTAFAKVDSTTSALQLSVQTETARALAAELVVSDAVGVEYTRALTAEQQLKQSMDDCVYMHNQMNQALKSDIVASNLQTDLLIQKEVSDRDAAIAERLGELISGAPEELNTLKEITDVLADNSDLGASLITQLATLSKADEADRLALLAEVTRAKTKETQNAADTTTEKNRATTVETTLSDRLDLEHTRVDTSITSVKDMINVNSEKSNSAEALLSNQLALEITRATNTEDGLTAAVVVEKIRATNAETNLAASVVNETARATIAEGKMFSALDLVTVDVVAKSTAILAYVTEKNNTLTSKLDTATNTHATDNTAHSLELSQLKNAADTHNTNYALHLQESSDAVAALKVKDTAQDVALDNCRDMCAIGRIALDVKYSTKTNTLTNNLDKLTINVSDEVARASNEENRLESKFNQNYIALNDNHVLLQSDVSNGDTSTLSKAKQYVDTKLIDLVGGASTEFDTLKEISTLMADNTNLGATLTSKLTDMDTKIQGVLDTYLKKSVQNLVLQELSSQYLYLGSHWRLKVTGDNENTLVTQYSTVANSKTDSDYTVTVPLSAVN